MVVLVSLSQSVDVGVLKWTWECCSGCARLWERMCVVVGVWERTDGPRGWTRARGLGTAAP